MSLASIWMIVYGILLDVIKEFTGIDFRRS